MSNQPSSQLPRGELLQVVDLHKRFDAQPVLRGVNLAVQAGEIVCLLGPSGCGKTTLLRIVAGLETPDQGAVYFEGQDLARAPVHKRGFGLMFQEFALFPHRNVFENVAFGLRMARWPAKDIQERVAAMLELVNLTGYETRSVFELSGGERQRVALARSLAPHPRLLMLDEPLGSLDRALREELMIELRRILKTVGVTGLYVTHDQQEAFAIADRVVVMHAGRFEQIGAPEEVYARPASQFVARFLGLKNLLPATVIAAAPERVETPLGSFHLPEPAAPGAYTLLIRPEIERHNIDQAGVGQPGTDQAGDGGVIEGDVLSVSFRGSDYHVDLGVRGQDGQAHRL
ncbi:MAG: ABC transporter ATP-binding protein, partial [Caldilineae bacterium]